MMHCTYIRNKIYDVTLSALPQYLTKNVHFVVNINILIYTVFHKKTTPYLIAHNFGKC